MTECRIQNRANPKTHLEIKYRYINVNFQANTIESRKLFRIDHSSDSIDRYHSLQLWLRVFTRRKKSACAKSI